jgi:hypothetical protein
LHLRIQVEILYHAATGTLNTSNGPLAIDFEITGDFLTDKESLLPFQPEFGPLSRSDLALNSEFRDFEDAIQYYTAIENNQDLIITRNLSDFRESKLPVMTAGEFIKYIEK